MTGFFQERQSRAAAYAVAGIGHPVGATFTGVRMLSKKTNKCPPRLMQRAEVWRCRHGHEPGRLGREGRTRLGN